MGSLTVREESGRYFECRLNNVKTRGLRKDIVDEAVNLVGRGTVTREGEDIVVQLTFCNEDKMFEFYSRLETKLSIRKIELSCLKVSEPQVRKYIFNDPRPVYLHTDDSPPESVRHSDSEPSVQQSVSSTSTFRKKVLESRVSFENTPLQLSRYEAAHLAPQEATFESPPFLCPLLFTKDSPLNGVLLSPTVHRLFDNDPVFYFAWTRTGSEVLLQVMLKRDCDEGAATLIRQTIDDGKLRVQHNSAFDAICRTVYLGLRRQWCESLWGVRGGYSVEADLDLILDLFQLLDCGFLFEKWLFP